MKLFTVAMALMSSAAMVSAAPGHVRRSQTGFCNGTSCEIGGTNYDCDKGTSCTVQAGAGDGTPCHASDDYSSVTCPGDGNWSKRDSLTRRELTGECNGTSCQINGLNYDCDKGTSCTEQAGAGDGTTCHATNDFSSVTCPGTGNWSKRDTLARSIKYGECNGTSCQIGLTNYDCDKGTSCTKEAGAGDGTTCHASDDYSSVTCPGTGNW